MFRVADWVYLLYSGQVVLKVQVELLLLWLCFLLKIYIYRLLALFIRCQVGVIGSSVEPRTSFFITGQILVSKIYNRRLDISDNGYTVLRGGFYTRFS